MKLFIEKIGEKPITTKKGPAIKVGVFSNNQWYSCFKGQWNEGWKQGMTIDVEVVQNGQYWNILPPKRQYAGNQDSDEIKGMLAQIMTELLALKAMMSFPTKEAKQVGPEEDTPVPSDDEEPTLPF